MRLKVLNYFYWVKKFLMTRIISVLIMHVLLHVQPYAQTKLHNEKIDSLVKILPKLQNDTSKVLILNELSYTAASIGEAKEGLDWANQGLLLAIQLSYKKGEAKAYRALGANYWVKHEYLTEQKFLLGALGIYQNLNDRVEIARTFRSIGDIYETEFNYPKALEYYQKSLLIAQEIHSPGDQIAYFSYIANVYDAEKNYSKALSYYQQAIKMCLDSINSSDTHGLGGLLRRTGLVYANQGNFDKALECEKKGLDINMLLKNEKGYESQYKWSLRALGTVYLQKGDYILSIKYFREAFNSFKLLTDAYSINDAGICLNKMGSAYLRIAQQAVKKNEFYYAQLKHAKDTLSLAVKWLKPRDWINLTEALQNLSTVYQLSGNMA